MHSEDISAQSPQRAGWRRTLKDNLLPGLTLLAVVVGIAAGFGLRAIDGWTGRRIMYLGFPGEVFLRILKCLILPLIFSSIASAVGSLDTSLSGKVALRAVVFYLTTTVMSVVLGIIMVTTIKPGYYGNVEGRQKSTTGRAVTTTDTLLDLVRNMFPTNIIEACFKMYRTVLVPPKNTSQANGNIYEWAVSSSMEEGSNILGLIVFAVTLGVALARLNEAGRPLLTVITSLNDAIMAITKAVIWLSPLGILFLVLAKIVEMEDLWRTAQQLGLYSATVLGGIFIHAVFLLPLIYFVFVRKNPYKFFYGLSHALTTAFATASSSATLPVTFSCLEQNIGLDRRISRFCIPIGATINMDGTALYEAVAALFIAQVRNVPLDIGKIVAVSLTATAASIGAAGIPQAGLVTLVLVLNSVGLPPEDVSLILMVDFLLDRFRTTLNVMGDSTGAAVVEHLSRHELEEMDLRDNLKSTKTTTANCDTGPFS